MLSDEPFKSAVIKFMEWGSTKGGRVSLGAWKPGSFSSTYSLKTAS